MLGAIEPPVERRRMLKLIEALIGTASGRGSRRIQFAAVCLAGVVTMPELSWQFISLAATVVASLTATDVLGKKSATGRSTTGE